MILPLTLFLTLQDKWLRTRLSLIFSTCIVTTIVSLVHAAYIFEDGGPKVTISALVEVSRIDLLDFCAFLIGISRVQSL